MTPRMIAASRAGEAGPPPPRPERSLRPGREVRASGLPGRGPDAQWAGASASHGHRLGAP